MTNPYFWEGTKIVKSLDNDFNWQRGESKFLNEMREYTRQSRAGAMGGKVTRKFDSIKQGYITPTEKPLQKTSVAFRSNKLKRSTK